MIGIAAMRYRTVAAILTAVGQGRALDAELFMARGALVALLAAVDQAADRGAAIAAAG